MKGWDKGWGSAQGPRKVGRGAESALNDQEMVKDRGFKKKKSRVTVKKEETSKAGEKKNRNRSPLKR